LGEMFKFLVEGEQRVEVASRGHGRHMCCGHCGKPLVEPESLDAEDVIYRIREILTGVIDGSGILFEVLEEWGWELGVSDRLPLEWLGEAAIVQDYGDRIVGMFAYPGWESEPYPDFDWTEHVLVKAGMEMKEKVTR